MIMMITSIPICRQHFQWGMERSKESRVLRRKECVLKVMKMVLANLEAQDREVMNEMKSEAFDLLRVCNTFEVELGSLFYGNNRSSKKIVGEREACRLTVTYHC